MLSVVKQFSVTELKKYSHEYILRYLIFYHILFTQLYCYIQTHLIFLNNCLVKVGGMRVVQHPHVNTTADKQPKEEKEAEEELYASEK